MKVFISAAEASSDTHAAEALKKLRVLAAAHQVKLEVYGIGGPKLRAQGLIPIIPAESLLAMGFVEVIGSLPRIARNLKELEAWAKKEKPSVAMLCDYPDFHFRLAARLKRMGIPTICYIPPKVWVWRQGRLKQLAKLYDRVLSILPFEEKTYQNTGVEFTYVGNPLMDELPLAMTRREARSHFQIQGDPKILLLMVGSRPAEFRFHLQPMIEAAVRVQEGLGNQSLQILLPLPETADLRKFKSNLTEVMGLVRGAEKLSVHVSQGDAWTAMKAADAAIIKSGTSSLEAALLDCPHVVIYCAHPVSEFIFKHIIRYRGAISLTNLVLEKDAGKKGFVGKDHIVKELILENFSPEKMGAATLHLFRDSSAVAEMRSAFSLIRHVLGERSPSLRVAESIIEVASRGIRNAAEESREMAGDGRVSR